MEMKPGKAAESEDFDYADFSCGYQLGSVNTIFQTAPATL